MVLNTYMKTFWNTYTKLHKVSEKSDVQTFICKSVYTTKHNCGVEFIFEFIFVRLDTFFCNWNIFINFRAMTIFDNFAG